MITVAEITSGWARPAQTPPRRAEFAFEAAPKAALKERVLVVILYVTVLASSVAFIEPSPHEGLMLLLTVACVALGVTFDRLLTLPLLLLLTWNVAGMISLLNVAGKEKTIQYTATSVYLGIAALVFACLLAQNPRRIAAIRSAYVLTAVIAALCGIAGYFSLFHGAYDLLTYQGRAQGLFKDPNVYGPFLIWPALIVLERKITSHITVKDLAVAGTIMLGLMLSFSRGAWFHLAVSCMVMIAMSFLTAPTQKRRMRIVVMTGIGVGLVAALVVVLLSIDSVGAMFKERANLINSYDVGDGGRFVLQQLALDAVLAFPNGMGPFEFASVHGLQQHNVYLQGLIVYGWVGGMAYILLVLSTLWIGFRASLIRTPWQPYLITAFGTFVGEVAEGFIIDTDHWRHYFLLLGMIWGLAAAAIRHQRAAAGQIPQAAFAAHR